MTDLKSDPIVVRSFTVPYSLHEALRELARSERRSLSSVIQELLRDRLLPRPQQPPGAGSPLETD